MAIITFGNTSGYKKGEQRIVHFGGIRDGGQPYSQFRDSTGLGIYSKYDHGDVARKNRYYARHGWNAKVYSPLWFSHHFLWS